MKRFTNLVLVGLLAIALCSCGYTRVEPKEEGVKIYLAGNDKGDLETLTTGRHFYNPWGANVELFPLYKQNIVWTADKAEGSKNDDSITFQNSDSMKFNADIGISFSVIPGHGKDLYAQYNKGIDEIAAIDMRNSVRSAFVNQGAVRDVEGVFGKGLPEFMNAVNNEVRETWKARGINVHEVYLIGAIRPDPQVIQSINAKVQAVQNALAAENKIAQSKAERMQAQEEADAKAYTILAKAKAEAKAIELVQEQLSKSPTYVDYVRAQKWDGKLPGITGGVIPMFDVNKD
jgi:regulator of protease activity HflC (stomatin/prohibitin superfamily)